MSQYPEVFTGVGTLKNHKVKLHNDSSIPPVAELAKVSSIPSHRERFLKEIKTIEEQNIIEKHEGPAPWVSEPVLAPKDDRGIRITVDMRQIKQSNQPMFRFPELKISNHSWQAMRCFQN